MKTVKMLAPGKIDVIQTEKPKRKKEQLCLKSYMVESAEVILEHTGETSHMLLIRESRDTNFLPVWSRWIEMSMESSRE